MSEFVKGKHGHKKKIRNKVETICTVTIINKLISQPEIIGISKKVSYETSHTFDKEQLCRYPRLSIAAYDNIPEFISEFSELLDSCTIKSQPITVENLHPNLVERIHKSLREIMRTKDLLIVKI